MQFVEERISNGLPVIVAPIEGTRAVASLLLVGWGAIHEQEEKRGTAHFLEHMMFKGTQRRPSKKELSEELDAMGAENNAFTAHEITEYYVKAAEQHHERAMDILSDMVLNSLIPEEEIARERRVIIEEMRMNRDTPMRHGVDLFYEMVFRPHALRRNIAGTEETLRSITRDDLQSFFDEGYRSGNAALVLAGAVEPEKGMEMAERYFGRLRTGGFPVSQPFVSEQVESCVHVETRAIDQSHLLFGCAGVPIRDPRRFSMKVLTTILGGNMSSRLFMAIREDRGIAYYVHTGVDVGKNYGLIFTQAGIETDQLSDALEVITAEHRRLKEEFVSENELRKAKEYIKGSLSLSLEDSYEMAHVLVEGRVLSGQVLTVEDFFSKIDSVTAEDIQELCRDLFVPERMNLALVTKKADGSRLKNIISTI